jgi:uncharacterized protein (DUF433 family)
MKKQVLHEYIAQVQQELVEDRLYDIADVDSRYHGIEHIVINIGLAAGEPVVSRLRVKVSNVKNKFDLDNQFDPHASMILVKYPGGLLKIP